MGIRARRATYYQLHRHLAGLDSKQLCALLDAPEQVGWSIQQTIKLEKKRVFVKRLPITAREMGSMYSTRNLYRLPLYYHYGVGSAGFGVFRELLAHIKTTSWVLQEEIESFPLMYHHRIIPRLRERATPRAEKIDGYVSYWNRSKRIRDYVMDRYRAEHELVIFLEYIPHTLTAWLASHVSRLRWVLGEMQQTIAFLRRKKIIHFDAHPDNILTDGKQVYLTDFGSLLDADFDIDRREREFFERHRYYDDGEVLLMLNSYVCLEYLSAAPSRQQRFLRAHELEGGDFLEINRRLLLDIEEIRSRGYFHLSPDYVEAVVQYRPVVLMMLEFLADMRRNNKKNTRFDHDRLKRLLRSARARARARA